MLELYSGDVETYTGLVNVSEQLKLECLDVRLMARDEVSVITSGLYISNIYFALSSIWLQMSVLWGDILSFTGFSNRLRLSSLQQTGKEKAENRGVRDFLHKDVHNERYIHGYTLLAKNVDISLDVVHSQSQGCPVGHVSCNQP